MEMWIHSIDQVADPADVQSLLAGEQQSIRDLQGRIVKINKYYDATFKTRIIVFVAYILLAAVLGFFYLYGDHILNTYYWGQSQLPNSLINR
jgi:hypothetical protein